MVSILIIGCGNRGSVYARYATEHPDLCRVIGVAEPREYTRSLFKEMYNIEERYCFNDWRDVIEVGKIADAVVITTQDRMHVEPAVAFADLGYHILLEKPMAVEKEDCVRIVEAVKQNDAIFAIGHVLRYTPDSVMLKGLLDDGIIGDIINIVHIEPVGYYHHAHSYVRGNWRNQDQATFMLMAKSCHDIDWISWMMDSKCTKVSSFGSLKHFNSANKPENAGSRCLNCEAEPECAFSAKKIYIDDYEAKKDTSFIRALCEDRTYESVCNAVETGPYGRCVYECDNNVVDNQVVNFQFENGATASFTMIAFSEDMCERNTHIYGTKGEIRMNKGKIYIFDFLTQSSKIYEPETSHQTSMNGHGGGDYFLMKDFIDAVKHNDQSYLKATPDQTLLSHLLVFEAEQSRLDNEIKQLSW